MQFGGAKRRKRGNWNLTILILNNTSLQSPMKHQQFIAEVIAEYSTVEENEISLSVGKNRPINLLVVGPEY